MTKLMDLCTQFINDPDSSDNNFVVTITDMIANLNHEQLVTLARNIVGWGRPL